MIRSAEARRFTLLFPGAMALFLFADWLAGAPPKVDQPLSGALWAALLIQFAGWICSIHCWGSLLARWLALPFAPADGPGPTLALGSLAFALLAFLLAAAGLLHPLVSYPLWMLQATGIALHGPRLLPRPVKLPACIPFLPLLLHFGLQALDSFPVSSYWDPLHHHLSSVRLFWENGRIYFPREAISAYQEGGFELLFLWPHFFLADFGGKGLLPVQIFAQWTHLLLGFGGSVAIGWAFARRWLPPGPWQALGLLFFSIPASLQLAIPFAKNDWGICLWVLAGAFLALFSHGAQPQKGRMAPGFIVAGVFWGLAFLGKLSSGFLIAGLGIGLLFPRRLTFPAMGWMAAGFLAGAAPLGLRNWWSTGNPFFPLAGELFPYPGWALGPGWKEALAVYGQSPSGFARLPDWLEEFPGAALLLALPLLAFIRKEDRALRSVSIALPAAALLFAFAAGNAAELRLLGGALPLAALSVVALAQRLSRALPLPSGSLAWALLGASCLKVPYRWDSLTRFPEALRAERGARSYVGGQAQGWFRDHYRPGMKAALLTDSRTYHSLPLPVIRIWDFPEADARLRAAADAPAFLGILRELGFTHLILSSEKLDLFYPKALVTEVENHLLRRRELQVFRTESSFVVDLALPGAPALPSSSGK